MVRNIMLVNNIIDNIQRRARAPLVNWRRRATLLFFFFFRSSSVRRIIMGNDHGTMSGTGEDYPYTLSEEEWKAKLNSSEFSIQRRRGFSSLAGADGKKPDHNRQQKRSRHDGGGRWALPKTDPYFCRKCPAASQIIPPRN